MRIRLHGTPDDIERTLARLGQVFDVTDRSRLCHDRGASKLARLYLQIDLEPGEPTRHAPSTPLR